MDDVPPLHMATHGMVGPGLAVPYFSQLDNSSGQGWRECFSSSVAMVLAFHGRVRSDDAYNQVRARYGDTTDPMAHTAAVQSLGLRPVFRNDCDRRWVADNLRRGMPVAIGWLHRGPVEAPAGGGHWSVVCATSEGCAMLHDPMGEPDLIAGGFVSGRTGRGVVCTWRNLQRRWEADGPGTGWAFWVIP